LENLIFKFLDSTFENIEIKKGKYSDIVFAFPGEEYGLIGWKKPSQLFTYYEIIGGVKTMFSMDEFDALDAIGRYVESRYNLEVNYDRSKFLPSNEWLKVDGI